MHPLLLDSEKLSRPKWQVLYYNTINTSISIYVIQQDTQYFSLLQHVLDFSSPFSGVFLCCLLQFGVSCNTTLVCV